MNKFLKVLACSLIGGTMLFATACGGGSGGGGAGNTAQKYDPEVRQLALSIGAVDGNFNPFFYTSLTDGQVISMTQSSLITSDEDENGNVVPIAGENYNTVARDFEITYYNAAGTKVSEQNAEQAADGGRTEYRFLIKNGMKFSDGTDLTIKDVLFNFYVYLDPVYTGSNTMYSVDIQGLKAYQNNDATLSDSESSNTGEYVTKAQARLQELIRYGKRESGHTTLSKQGEKDFERVKVLYREELESDWNSIETSWVETYEVNYTFKEAWQAYLFNEGIVTAQMRRYSDGTLREIRVDAVTGVEIDPTDKEAYALGKVKTTLDPWVEGANGARPGMTENQQEIDDVEAATTEEKLLAYMTEHSCDEDTARLQLSKAVVVDKVYRNNMPDDGSGLDEVLSYWATGTNAYNEFLADERGQALAGSANPQYYIRGIQTEKVTSFKGVDLGASYDVLKVIVNEVDPAAIWQFGITIAPMNYYSGTYQGIDYIASFNGDQIDYANDPYGDVDTCFGVKRGDFNFFTEVVKGTDTGKSALPRGAGPYMASTVDGGTASVGYRFKENNIVYYERNPYFETMGSGLNNAKIKYLRYKVLNEDRILPSILSGTIDYGEPNATTINDTTVNDHNDTLGKITYQTNGFGYVGINPTYVPNIGVRRIIMRAMNISLTKQYYGSLAELLYRPMSLTSWAYPDGVGAYYEPLGNAEDIKQELRDLGYHEGSDGVFTNGTDRLKYTFTIAGANVDHPAYNMFLDAQRTLNSAGFDISISTDPNALIKLTSGGLAVWAAAWSSGVDPDMYQVYHKDSLATSVLNWGYRTIYNDVNGIYGYERGVIDLLSEKIEEARSTTLQSRRAEIYADCLDDIMDLAIELPAYQRDDMCVFNKNVIDSSTINTHANATNGVLDRIWEVNYL